MTKIAKFEDLTGAVDGVNVDFFVPAACLPVDPDSERVFLRGLPRVKDWDDGWDVIDYPTGHIRLKEPPYEGDAPPALLFLQDIGDVVTGEVTPISGHVRKEVPLCGSIQAERAAQGCLEREVSACPGQLRQLSVRGSLVVERRLTGSVESD